MLRNYAAVFIAQNWEEELIKTVHTILVLRRAPPAVNKWLLRIIAAAAYSLPDGNIC